jgi:hypothetical protein
MEKRMEILRTDPFIGEPVLEKHLRKYPRDLDAPLCRFVDTTIRNFFSKNKAIVAFIDVESYLDPTQMPRTSRPLPVEVTLTLIETVAFLPEKIDTTLWTDRYDPITHSITWHIHHDIFQQRYIKCDESTRRTNRYTFDNVLGIAMPHDPHYCWKPVQSGWRFERGANTVTENEFLTELREALSCMTTPFSKTHAVIAYKGGHEEKKLFDAAKWEGDTFDLEDLYCPNFDKVPGALLSLFPECGHNFHIPADALRHHRISGTTKNIKIIDWPAMAIYQEKKNNKYRWTWQHCPLRETCFMRFWTSRFFPFLLPMYPCIMMTKNDAPLRVIV